MHLSRSFSGFLPLLEFTPVRVRRVAFPCVIARIIIIYQKEGDILKYLRFGEIPEGGKSINFLRLSFAENEAFTEKLNDSSYSEAVAALPADCLEPGISVFEMDADGLPVLSNINLVRSLSVRIGAPVYEISGEVAGTGADGEPLITGVNVIKRRRISREKLINCILRSLVSHFRSAQKTDAENDSCELRTFTVQKKINIVTSEQVDRWTPATGEEWILQPERKLYSFAGWDFSDPVGGFCK